MATYNFRYLVERDADFAIIKAFEANQDVRELFLSGFRDPNSTLLEVWHSHMQQEEGYGYGESDIIFIMEDRAGKFAILIEDKIKAAAQPDQAQRYETRARELQVGDFRVFLCAPQSYLDQKSKDVTDYHYHISYEMIVAALPDGLEKEILRKAASGTSCPVPDQGVTSFWNSFRAFVEKYYPDELTMKGKFGDKPSGSMWQEFETDLVGCSLVMKIDSRKVELEFRGMGPRLDELNVKLEECGIDALRAIRTNRGKSKSASIQTTIDEADALSVYVPFAAQQEKAAVWVRKAIELMGIARVLLTKGISEFPL